MKTLARPARGDPGAFFSATWGTMAASTCSSPSQHRLGARFFSISVAACTFATFGWSAEPRVEKESFCCGAGGANYWGGAGGDERISDVRSREALETGAGKIATSCPFCMLMLTDGVSKQTEEPRVFDLAELVVDAMPESSDEDRSG